jgi:hypothetical protein
VKPPMEAIEEGISKWPSSLVGQFLDKHLPYYVVKCTVESIWAQYGKIEVLMLENGLYLFKFADEKSRDEVLEAKVWHIANKSLILRKWTLGMQLLKISLSSVHVWIKLHNLSIEFWNATYLSYVASGVGKPICADSITEEQLRLEVDMESGFPKEIEIVGVDGGRVVVRIEYPWLPLKCMKYKSFGHLSHSCTKIEKQVWHPKKVEPVQKYVSVVDKVDELENVVPNKEVEPKWNAVRVKITPALKNNIKDSKSLWANSFHLLARANGNIKFGFRELEIFSSLQNGVEFALGEESAKVKEKGKMGEEEEILMRGFSPT